MAKDFIPDHEFVSDTEESTAPQEASPETPKSPGIAQNLLAMSPAYQFIAKPALEFAGGQKTQDAIEPEGSPIDIAAGSIGGRLARPVMQGAEAIAPAAGRFLAEEAGELRIPSRHKLIEVPDAKPLISRHRIINQEGQITGMGSTPEEAIQDHYRVSAGSSKGSSKSNLNPNSQFSKVTSFNPSAPKLGPHAQETLQKIKEKDLSFFDPESFENSFVAKDQYEEPIGHLGLDADNRTQSIKVHPDAQNQGVAGNLYEKAVNKLGLLRSSHVENQLPGGQGLWKKFAEEHPHNIWQARNPDTLEPLDYKVWQKNTNPELRQKEIDIENKIDALRKNIKVDPDLLGADYSIKSLNKGIEKAQDRLNYTKERLANPADLDEEQKAFLIKDLEKQKNIIAHHDDLIQKLKIGGDEYAAHLQNEPVELNSKSLQSWQTLLENFSKPLDQLSIQDQVNVQYRYKPEEVQNIIQKIQKEMAEYPEKHAAWEKKGEKILRNAKNKTSVQAQINNLIQQHKAINKQSNHTMFAAGGIVTAGNPKLQQAYAKMADGGNVADFIPDEQFTADQGPSAAPQAAGEGFIPDSEFVSDEEKYGTPSQQAKTAVEGLAQGVVGPLAPLVETQLLGVKAEDILRRQEANPYWHYGTEIAGLALPAIVSGGGSVAAKTALGETAAQMAKLTQVGAIEAAAKKLVPEAGETLASKIGTAAAKGAVENALVAGSDEVSRMILEDPKQTAETAIADVGLGAILGAGIGGAFGAVPPLWKATVGDKVGKFAADFRGRILEHVNNPDPVHSMTRELTDYFGQVNKIGSEIYGEEGLKAEAINKVLPELNEKIIDQVGNISEKVSDAVDKLKSKGDPYASILEDKLSKFTQDVNQNEPSKIFSAIQELKKSLQADSRYTEGVSPLAERAYRSTAKSLAHDIRTSLEDTEVWGKAGELQSSINSAFSDWLKATKDFRGLMTTDVMGEKMINPAKVQTYLNQLGKAQAEIKTTKLQNFLEYTENLKNAVNKAYDTLGVESPIHDTPLNVTLSTLDKKTIGSKAADFFIDKALTDAGGKAIGAGVGAAVGSAIGLGKEVGAIIGTMTLGRFFSSILPAIAKQMVAKDPSPTGLRAAVEYMASVVKGENLIGKATQNVFKAEREVLPETMIPNDNSREKLNKMLLKMQDNPNSLMPTQAPSSAHYMPDHTNSLNETAMNAASYLNAIRAPLDKKAPLDPTPVMNKTQQAQFNNALSIAQQPLIVLDKIKKGTLTTQDITILSSMYPALYNRLKARLQDEMMMHVSKGEKIPYTTRIGLSMFLGQPLDSTLTPSAIQTMQAVGAAQPTQQPGQQPVMPKGAAPKGVKSSPALQKMPNLFQTPAQAKELHRSRR